jgi:hypothetical protein
MASTCSRFLAALGLFVLSFIGLGISFYPYIVPWRADDRGGSSARKLAEVPAGWRACAGAYDPCLYRLRLLGVPRQDRSGGRLPLMAASDTKVGSKLVWFAGIWLASVLALGVVAYAIKLVI